MSVYKNVLSFGEIRLHNKVDDCWVIINAKAYDVSNFLTDHPGGEEVLLAATGKDASEEFENAGHGSASRLMLDEFYVGEVDPLTMPITTTDLPTQLLQKNDAENFGCILKALMFVVSIAILIFAVGMTRFMIT